MPPKKGEKHAKPKQRVHLADAAIVLVELAYLGSQPDDNIGGQTAIEKMEYALESADAGNWTDPANGVAVNAQYAVTGLIDNAVSIDGAVALGAGYLAHRWVHGSRSLRSWGIRTKHHVVGA